MVLISNTDQILKTKTEKFDFTNPPIDPIELSHILAKNMLEYNGFGLSATQLGLPYRAFAMKSNPIIVCFNPILVDTSDEQISLEEGCLSFPNLILKIKRPIKIKVRYTEPNGNTKTTIFEGLTARIFLHEYDHLEGVLFTKKVSRLHLEQAKKKAKKINENR